MAAKNTLLDFLTQRADRQATREFQRVVADAKDDIPSPELENLFRTLFKSKGGDVKKFYGDDKDDIGSLLPQSDGEKFGQWLKKAKDSKGQSVWDDFKKQFKGKDPLDMTPSDLENLFRVYRDQSDKPVALNILLDPSLLESPMNPQQIASAVNKFYNDNKQFFTSPKDLTYDAKSKMLHYEGSDLKLKGLLDALKVKHEAQESIFKQKKEISGVWYIPFTGKIKSQLKPGEEQKPERPFFSDWATEDRFQDAGKAIFKKFQEAVDANYEENVKEGWLKNEDTYEWVNDNGQQILKFQGSLSDIKTLFSGVYDNLTHMLQTIKAKASDYKRIGE